MSKYTRTKETAQKAAPDQFIGFWQRLYEGLIPYFSRALVLLIFGIVVAGVSWGVSQWLEGRRERATEALGRAVRINEAELLSDKDKDKDKDLDLESEIPRFKTANERAEATLKALDELDKSYGSSAAAQRGVLVRAGVQYDLGRYADAEASYRRFLNDKPRADSLVALAQEGMGLCAQARGDLPMALSVFENLASIPFYRSRALWNQAHIYTRQGNKKKAIEIYKELLSKATPQDPMRDDIQNRLAALEF